MPRVHSLLAQAQGSVLDDPPEATVTSSVIGPAMNESVHLFDAVYDEHFDFVWRSARRLGVNPASTDDVVQEVFVVVHRKLAQFEGRSGLKTWLFAILLQIVRRHRRTFQRKEAPNVSLSPIDFEAIPDTSVPNPLEAAETVEELRLLDSLLAELDDDKREVFVLVQIEQLSLADVAEIVGENPNTLYSRLRVARRDFEGALTRHRARE